MENTFKQVQYFTYNKICLVGSLGDKPKSYTVYLISMQIEKREERQGDIPTEQDPHLSYSITEL